MKKKKKKKKEGRKGKGKGGRSQVKRRKKFGEWWRPQGVDGDWGDRKGGGEEKWVIN